MFGPSQNVCADGTCSDPRTESVLAVDDRVLCEEHAHEVLQSRSFFLIVTFAVGVPVVFWVSRVGVAKCRRCE